MFNKITLGPITVYMYGLMIAIGFASALFLCNYRGKKRGLSEDTILPCLNASIASSTVLYLNSICLYLIS